jgi:beta-lactamase class A
MPEKRMVHCPLLDQLLDIGAQNQVGALAVALYDYGADLHFSYQAGRTFHAASTIKLAILLALFRASEEGRLRLNDRLHVRNRFRSQADGSPFFLQADRDGDPELYKSIGRTASLLALAETMIVRSSNLATNLLFNCIGAEFIAGTLAASGLEALRCVRGVEDEAAFAKGMNNQVTAGGLLKFFRRVHEEKILSPLSRERLFDILFQQRFNAMIPAGLPDSAKARVAHKTGEISTVCHDAGMIFLPGRSPYVLVVLTEYPAAGSAGARNKTVAAVSAAVFEFLQSANESLTRERSAKEARR